jgi:hypothetical protein
LVEQEPATESPVDEWWRMRVAGQSSSLLPLVEADYWESVLRNLGRTDFVQHLFHMIHKNSYYLHKFNNPK